MQEASEEMNLLISVLLLKNGGVTFKIDMNDQNTLLNLLFPEKAL